MANASFTRDEVILALDVFYSAGSNPLNNDSPLIVSLSELLNRLPIHSARGQKETFRNCSGVSTQIARFRRGLISQERAEHVGNLFFEVEAEFKERHTELHAIAEAIRRNEPYYEGFSFGNEIEAQKFPEGALLSHLHRMIETRDGEKHPKGERCAICQIKLSDIYSSSAELISNHLLVPLTQLDGSNKYSASDYISVCPTCHAALHRFRPWLTRETCGDILR